MANLLTISDAAKFIGKITGNRPHTSTVARWMLKGNPPKLTRHKIGGRLYVNRDELISFMQGATPDSSTHSTNTANTAIGQMLGRPYGQQVPNPQVQTKAGEEDGTEVKKHR